MGPSAIGGDSPARAAWRDYVEGIHLFPIWSMLGWQDIRQRYRRSVIGPFWLSISTAIMVGAMGFLYSGLFKQNIQQYLPFLAIGLIVWGFISTVCNDAPNIFVGADGMMKQIRLPLTMYVCRMVWRNLIIFAHNAIIILAVMLWAQTPITWELWLIPVAILIYSFNSLNIGLLLGILCTRFRDIGQLVANFIQLLFFITPIMWSPDILTGKDANRAWVAQYNPAYHFIEIIRAPVLGQPLPQNSWLIVLAATFLVWVLAFLSLIKFRHRVTYWL
ncbi:ABC transporter permease [Polynucleobacter sphagniphilus]|uniref:ABC transporter permease n=1 Tax=Polynucleobacter sphagniphilus TaxID=1743169 RepID=UPI002476548F|nr:ABC transporter permease [Polynucleobacter sphagniphilus]